MTHSDRHNAIITLPKHFANDGRGFSETAASPGNLDMATTSETSLTQLADTVGHQDILATDWLKYAFLSQN
ncbi:MAG: hypothetical protein CBE00_03080 [Planctomycetaceae bacterium TMED240]|nr:hypothetical protein [Rhodopirellula sp.]OUX07879.1 MAG: hypothetical protein CBE00_03080 [Planctomycetaceae bacterium TMED240]